MKAEVDRRKVNKIGDILCIMLPEITINRYSEAGTSRENHFVHEGINEAKETLTNLDAAGVLRRQPDLNVPP